MQSAINSPPWALLFREHSCSLDPRFLPRHSGFLWTCQWEARRRWGCLLHCSAWEGELSDPIDRVLGWQHLQATSSTQFFRVRLKTDRGVWLSIFSYPGSNPARAYQWPEPKNSNTTIISTLHMKELRPPHPKEAVTCSKATLSPCETPASLRGKKSAPSDHSLTVNWKFKQKMKVKAKTSHLLINSSQL